MPSYNVTVTLAATPTGNVLVSNGSSVQQLNLPPLSQAAINAQVAAQMNNYVAGRKVSTDGSHGLSAPTGSGLEFVFDATGLADIRYDGVSQ